MSVQDPAESGEVITLYFDGSPQTFSINDLAVSLALFLNPGATPAEIQQVATDIFGLSLTPAQITGAGSNPLANFDLNGDGNLGQIEDLGVALAVFLGQGTADGVNQVCQDVLGLACGVSPSVALPGPEATPFPGQPSPTPGSQVAVTTLVDEDGSNPDACSLREAIIANNTGSAFGGCTDPQGTITFDSALNGTIVITNSALPDITRDVEIKGLGSHVLAVSGNNQFPVFTASDDTAITVDKLTITQGSTFYRGGEISAGTVTVSNSTLSGNSARITGGGIYTTGTATVSDSTLSGNSSGAGGGITARTATVSNSTISGNSGNDLFGGGGITADTVTVSDSTLSGNSTEFTAGGIRARTVTVNNSILSGNSGRAAGGIYSLFR